MSSPTLAKLEALMRNVPASTYGGSIDGAAATYIANGDYFLSSAAPGYSNALLTATANLLSAAVPGTTVVLQSNGTVKVTWGSGSHTFAFASNDFRSRLGFTGDIASAPSATGAQQADCIWLPNVYLSGHLGSVEALGTREDDSRIRRAQSGKFWRTSYNAYYKQRFEWFGLTKSKVWRENETDLLGAVGNNGSFESFWLNFLSYDGAFRLYPDASSTTHTTPINGTARDYVFLEWEPPKRVRPNVDTVWQIGFNAGYAA